MRNKMRKTIILAFATAVLAVCATVTDLIRAYAGDAPLAPAVTRVLAR
jgi:hypothetical protein